MKKYLALLLSMLLLVGCARIEPEQGGTKPELGQPDDVSAKLLSQYALAEVKLPELPAEPSEEELWAAYEKLDYDKMGEEAYHKAQEELWTILTPAPAPIPTRSRRCGARAWTWR